MNTTKENGGNSGFDMNAKERLLEECHQQDSNPSRVTKGFLIGLGLAVVLWIVALLIGYNFLKLLALREVFI